MKIERAQIEKITISEVARLDPITVILEDLGHRQGQITVSCYGKSWTAYFGGCGDKGIAHFVGRDASADYLADRFLSNAGEETTEPSLEAAQESVTKEILEDRRARRLTHTEARKHYDRIQEDWPETMDGAWNSSSGILQKFLGEEWWYAIPNRPTHGYLYCKRIVEAVKAAIVSMKEPAKEAA